MANDAVQQQLPIMVRRPKVVWPGLDRMDLQRKMIAGDGNCLFASLADQLYGNPARHDHIRAAIIDHMRTYRPVFENVAIKDDIQQKRVTRAQTNAIRSSNYDDTFEEYLAIMSRPGTYGGEPELVAFVQCFDQDVLIHLPRMVGYPESIPYTNPHRQPDTRIKPTLHLCYGGDEATNAHYDSVQRSTPAYSTSERPVTAIREVSPTSSVSSVTRSLTSRAIRNSKADISRDMMHDLVVRGTSDLRYTFDQLNDSDRARSPSVSSSHYSNSSKRSYDDDGEQQKSVKKTDRRKSTRARMGVDVPTHTLSSTAIKVRLNTGLATPASTQDSEYSSDLSDRGSDVERLRLRPRRKMVSRSLTPDLSEHFPHEPRRASTTVMPVSTNLISRRPSAVDQEHAPLPV